MRGWSQLHTIYAAPVVLVWMWKSCVRLSQPFRKRLRWCRGRLPMIWYSACSASVNLQLMIVDFNLWVWDPIVKGLSKGTDDAYVRLNVRLNKRLWKILATLMPRCRSEIEARKISSFVPRDVYRIIDAGYLSGRSKTSSPSAMFIETKASSVHISAAFRGSMRHM